MPAALAAVEGASEPVDWWRFDAGPTDEALAADVGFAPTRHLHQMRRPLPTGLAVDVTTRPFEVGRRRGGVGRAQQPGLRRPPRAGRLDRRGACAGARPSRGSTPPGSSSTSATAGSAAFCWTKLHADAGGTNIGEIYVIGVDPDFQGLGLGRQLTLAGLDAIAARGVDVGMLYVDADNAAAVTLYEQLGFTVARTDRAFRYEPTT